MKRYIGILAVLAGLAALPAGSSAAQGDSVPKLVITDVDTTRYPEVEVYLAAPDGQLPDPQSLKLAEDGQAVVQQTAQTQDVGVAVAVAISLRRSMRGQGLPGSTSRLADARALAGEIATALTSHVDLIAISGFHEEVVPVVATQVLSDGGKLRNDLYNAPPEQLADFDPKAFMSSDSNAYAALSEAILSATRALSPTLFTAQSGIRQGEVDIKLRRQFKAIVVIADSCDDLDKQYKTPGAQSCVVPEEVRRALAAQADTLAVFAVGVGTDKQPQIKPSQPDAGYGYVANYALLRQYGGDRFVQLSKPEDLQLPALRTWLDKRRRQLVVTYHSHVNGGEHEIMVAGGTHAVSFSEPRIPPKAKLGFNQTTRAFRIDVEYTQEPITGATYYRNGVPVHEVNIAPFEMRLQDLQLSQTAIITASITTSNNFIFVVPGQAEIPALAPIASPSPIQTAFTPPESEPLGWPLYAVFALMLAALATIGALWWARRHSGAPLPSTELPPETIKTPEYALATLPDRKEIYPLQPGTTIVGSRKDATDITLALPGILEQHLTIAPRSDRRLDVIDKPGSSGTFINNIRLTPGRPMALDAGDLLTLGTTTLKCIRWPAGDQAPRETAEVQATPQSDMAAREVGV